MADDKFYLDQLDALLGQEPYGPVEDELFTWYTFAHFHLGKRFRELKKEEFAAFKEKLIPLIDVVYQWHQEKKEKEWQ